MRKSTFIVSCICCISVTTAIILGIFFFWKDDTNTEPVKVEKEQEVPPKKDQAEENESVSTTDNTTVDENSASVPQETESIWCQVPDTFTLSSGVGSWGTTITINDDGTFVGEYHDTNMGEIGPDSPNGTVYTCNFSGKFSTPTQLNSTVYSMRLENITLQNTPGQSYFSNGVKYIFSEPYGLENPNILYLYMPGTLATDMGEGFLSWVHTEVSTALPPGTYGIHNAQEDLGFVSYPY